ncbi:hypothetical protein IEQ34_002924 [Dendrobium chrysotoxum]|uniref:AT-hook motif nuclear-localized protein n=1 Tax=Dendrobium chrysotoxum TaxID=161865 RepID=A0AAV7HFV7_DENCH|nr:hypothetical protein IEQ34_002924 [Dendrobium chrysotoxum]
MDGRGNSDLRSYFNHLDVIDGAASFSTAGKEIFSTPFSSAAVDANSFAIPCAVTARSTSARPAAAATIAAESAKRKRGRPRKYGARPSLPSLPTSPMSAAARAFSPLAQRPSLNSSSRKKESTSSNSSARNAQLTALGLNFTLSIFLFV